MTAKKAYHRNARFQLRLDQTTLDALRRKAARLDIPMNHLIVEERGQSHLLTLFAIWHGMYVLMRSSPYASSPSIDTRRSGASRHPAW